VEELPEWEGEGNREDSEHSSHFNAWKFETKANQEWSEDWRPHHTSKHCWHVLASRVKLNVFHSWIKMHKIGCLACTRHMRKKHKRILILFTKITLVSSPLFWRVCFQIVLMYCANLKNNFKKNHFNAFLNKKHFKPQPLSQSQPCTCLKSITKSRSQVWFNNMPKDVNWPPEAHNTVR